VPQKAVVESYVNPVDFNCVLPGEFDSDNVTNDDLNLYVELQDVKTKHCQNVIIGHININSLRHKFVELEILLRKNLIDILVVTETKLDASFNSDLFRVPNFCMYRQDNTSRSGGIIVYVKDCITNTFGEVRCLETTIEYITIDIAIDKSKYVFIAMYKHPQCIDKDFELHFEKIYDCVSKCAGESILAGDLNFNMLNKNCLLHDLCDRYDLRNLVKKPTCYKAKDPTLLDIIIVSNRNLFMSTFVIDINISDFHFMVGTVMRKYLPPPVVEYRNVRNYKRINYSSVKSDLSDMDIAGEVYKVDNPSTKFNILQKFLTSILDKHAPSKRVKIRHSHYISMSPALKSLIRRRNLSRRKFFKNRSKFNFIEYRKLRNKVNILKRAELNKSIQEKCRGGSSNADFWKTVNPYFNKKSSFYNRIMLSEGSEVLSDTAELCDVFNNYFAQIGSDIGSPEPDFKTLEDILEYYANDKGISVIKEKANWFQCFSFSQVTEKNVMDAIHSLKNGKATGADDIPAVFIKTLATELAPQITSILNECIWQNVFPEDMKISNITPLYKKKDRLCKENYRPVNILTALSKIFERILYDQQYTYFKDKFHKLISGFRKGHSCSSMLLKLTEDIRKALDQGYCMGLIAMDLTKAFNVIPIGLFIAKIKAYGYSDSACKLMLSYLTNRSQRVKINESVSKWETPNKGVPQGSILGPLVFNIFMNDFLYLDFHSSIYNYADDNTLALMGDNFDVVKRNLELDAIRAVDWFMRNRMQANPEKFQVIFYGKNVPKSFCVKIGDIQIKALESIDILGVTLDNKLKFDLMVKEICRRAGSQINVLQRIKLSLDKASRTAVYNSFISSNLLYCQLIWMYCGRSNIQKMEKMNERALRFVNNDYASDYEGQLTIAGKEKLLVQRIINMAIEVYKARQGLTATYIQEMFINRVTCYDLRGEDTVILPVYKTRTYGYRSFSYMGAKLWNTLSNEIRQASTLSKFKSLIREWVKHKLNVDDFV